MQLEAGEGWRSTTSGLKPGRWACKESDYLDLKRASRRETGPGSADPLVPYRLVIACYKSSGTEFSIGFADGTSANWHYASAVWEIEEPGLDAIKWQDLSNYDQLCATMVEDLVELLYMQEGRGLTRALALPYLVEDEADLVTADFVLGVSQLWGLVASEQSDYGDDVLLSLTDAGFVWHEAADERYFETQRRRERMRRRGADNSINIGGNLNAPLTVAGRDIRGGVHNVTRAGLSDQDVLGYLGKLLGSEMVPWDTAELSKSREVIESAVRHRAVDDHRLRTAVRSLLKVAGGIVLGVLGNAAYQGLQGFFQSARSLLALDPPKPLYFSLSYMSMLMSARRFAKEPSVKSKTYPPLMASTPSRKVLSAIESLLIVNSHASVAA
jgi:hypothetical protein